MRLPGVGKVLGALFFAEIGDISRFETAKKRCSWAGLTPKHRETEKSDASALRTKHESRPRTDASPANAVAHRCSVWPSHLIAPGGTWPTPIMAEIAECMAGRPTGDRANLAVMGNLFT